MYPPIENQNVSPLLTEEELQEFRSVYPEIWAYLKDASRDMVPETDIHTEWMMKGLDYNVLGGKMLRGILVPATYKRFTKEFNAKDMRLACIIGWLEEIFQAACLIADDIMDNSETRRGKPCWYKNKEVGMLAVNDVLLLENLAYTALRHFVGDNATLFMELNDCFRENAIRTIYGQSLDCLTATGSDDILQRYTMERYSAIVKYKTSYYTMFLPVALGMIVAGKSQDKETMDKMTDILLEVGHYFQVQDDYLDCFGDPERTGKIGTDIQDSKCSWLFVKAVEKCNSEELSVLLDNYGSQDSKKVEKVKSIYRDLDLTEAFEEFEVEAYCKIEAMIKKLREDSEQALRDLFLSIYKRTK